MPRKSRLGMDPAGPGLLRRALEEEDRESSQGLGVQPRKARGHDRCNPGLGRSVVLHTPVWPSGGAQATFRLAMGQWWHPQCTIVQ